MKRNDTSRQKPFPVKIAALVGVFCLIAVLALTAALRAPKVEQPEAISLSKIAAAIAQGGVTRIEDTLTGEITVHYQNGEMKKGLRDPGAPLLEQLNLLGLTKEQLSKVQFEIVRPGMTSANGSMGFLLAIGVVGTMAFAAVRLSQTDRRAKKKYEASGIPNIRFSDVAGLDENVQELRDVVTFLKEGDKFAEMGAKMPRGVLMVGDPGTGKTLIAKAVAGEAGVPFFATSGSEFTEVYVGVGASRIRSLFQKARKKAPCIVFIDEIDAVGRARHRSESGAEMEQDQTLNQLLVEMDGFDSSEGVMVLAATNRVDVLDSALTRPGRFDRQVYINRPDVKGRQQILKIHVKGKKLSIDASLEKIAKATPGLVGADLANLVNEAAISAVRNGHTEIHMRDFEEAIEKHMAGGVARKSQVLAEDERRIVAYHEAGHAVAIHVTPQSDPVFKVTIIPRGQAGGYTMAVPEQDQILISKCKLLARITGLLGGRAAEEVFFQDVTSGASNDLNVATQFAEEMVMRLGMDPKSGLRVFAQASGRSAQGLPGSQKTYETIDEAVKNILDSCYAEARRIMVEQRECVERLANELLEVETIDRERFLELMSETQSPSKNALPLHRQVTAANAAVAD